MMLMYKYTSICLCFTLNGMSFEAFGCFSEVNDYFERIEDEVHRSSFDRRSSELLKAAKRSIGGLHQVAERLGAQAAYQEAESSARFREEEKRWESYSPKAQRLGSSEMSLT